MVNYAANFRCTEFILRYLSEPELRCRIRSGYHWIG